MRFSVVVPRSKKPLAAAMLRKYSRLRRPGGLRREYKKLRSLLPGATRSRHLRKKVGVVEAAYQYICELQTALLNKFSTKGIPEDLAGIVRGKVATASDIQALALHLINNSPSINNNNNNNFLRSSYTNSTTSATRSPFLPHSSEQNDLYFQQINTTRHAESTNTSVPKTTTTVFPADATMDSASVAFVEDFCHECTSSAITESHRTASSGCSNSSSPCDSSTHTPVASSTHMSVEVPMLSKNISDISLSVKESSTTSASESSSSGSSH